MLTTKLLHTIYSLEGFGETSLRKLDDAFQSAEAILSASREQFEQAGISPKAIRIFFDQKERFDIDCDWEALQQQKISVYSQGDSEYPKLLKEIPDAPPLLYLRGDIEALNTKPCIALVGTRKPTDYGRHITRTLARELSGAGIVVVSGLALGLDAEAHAETVSAHGLTVAVLGSGLGKGRIAPQTNVPLARRIVASGGALVSEFPPDTPASIGTFPLRNRIIAGLTLGTIVVEAGEKSGTLITARLALEYNREVFAVPGSILSPLSQGANRLLKSGAHPVTCTQDILDILALTSHEKNSENPISQTNLSPEDTHILNALSSGPLTSQELSQRTQLSPSTINTRLTLLEIQGCITDIGGGKYFVH